MYYLFVVLSKHLFQIDFYRPGAGYKWPVPLSALLALPQVKVARLLKLPSEQEMKSIDGYLFMLPTQYTPVSHCVAVRKFVDGRHFLLDSALPVRPTALQTSEDSDPWRPKWNKEPLPKQKFEKLLTEVLVGDRPSTSDAKARYDAPLLFAVSSVPEAAVLENLDTMTLYRAFSAANYERVARLCDFPLKQHS